MPPIVVDGKTKNQNTLIQDLRANFRGKFSIKHTNNSTILFVKKNTIMKGSLRTSRTKTFPITHTRAKATNRTPLY